MQEWVMGVRLTVVAALAVLGALILLAGSVTRPAEAQLVAPEASRPARVTLPPPMFSPWYAESQAEIEIGLFARQCLGKRRIPSLAHLQLESRAWNRRVNRDKGTINWRFTRKKARQTFDYDKNLFTRS